MYLIFDTETSGLPKNWNAPVTDINNWPRLVQLAYHLYDKNGNIISYENFIIKPEGFTIPLSASEVHGISNEKALNEGESLKLVLDKLKALIDQSEVLIAHNMKFDERVIGAEFLRTGLNNNISLKSRICTMERSTNYCAISGPYGYKWPTLSELHYKLFRTGFKEAHNAAIDVEITAKCFFKLKDLGIIKDNAPHHSFNDEKVSSSKKLTSNKTNLFNIFLSLFFGTLAFYGITNSLSYIIEHGFHWSVIPPLFLSALIIFCMIAIFKEKK